MRTGDWLWQCQVGVVAVQRSAQRRAFELAHVQHLRLLTACVGARSNRRSPGRRRQAPPEHMGGSHVIPAGCPSNRS